MFANQLLEKSEEKMKKKYNLINDETRRKIVEMIEINNSSLKEVIFISPLPLNSRV